MVNTRNTLVSVSAEMDTYKEGSPTRNTNRVEERINFVTTKLNRTRCGYLVMDSLLPTALLVYSLLLSAFFYTGLNSLSDRTGLGMEHIRPLVTRGGSSDRRPRYRPPVGRV